MKGDDGRELPSPEGSYGVVKVPHTNWVVVSPSSLEYRYSPFVHL